VPLCERVLEMVADAVVLWEGAMDCVTLCVTVMLSDGCMLALPLAVTVAVQVLERLMESVDVPD
jgi:hypothetical protein